MAMWLDGKFRIRVMGRKHCWLRRQQRLNGGTTFDGLCGVQNLLRVRSIVRTQQRIFNNCNSKCTTVHSFGQAPNWIAKVSAVSLHIRGFSRIMYDWRKMSKCRS
jgi:hypothetical protein